MFKTKVNLENEITDSFKQKKESMNAYSAVAEVKGLLGYEDVKDSRMLRLLAPNCEENFAQEQLGQKIILENLEEKFGMKAIDLEDIEKLCKNYRLRFLSSVLFIGAFTPKVLHSLKEFATKHEINLESQGVLTSDFFIMAPEKMFKLEKGEVRRPLITLKDPDPSIFYKTKEDKYVHITTWGGDLNVSRRVKGFVWKNHTNFFLSATMVYLVALLAIGSLTTMGRFPLATLILCLVLAPFAGVLTMFSWDGFLSSQTWNSPKKNVDRKYIFS